MVWFQGFSLCNPLPPLSRGSGETVGWVVQPQSPCIEWPRAQDFGGSALAATPKSCGSWGHVKYPHKVPWFTPPHESSQRTPGPTRAVWGRTRPLPIRRRYQLRGAFYSWSLKIFPRVFISKVAVAHSTNSILWQFLVIFPVWFPHFSNAFCVIKLCRNVRPSFVSGSWGGGRVVLCIIAWWTFRNSDGIKSRSNHIRYFLVFSFCGIFPEFVILFIYWICIYISIFLCFCKAICVFGKATTVKKITSGPESKSFGHQTSESSSWSLRYLRAIKLQHTKHQRAIFFLLTNFIRRQGVNKRIYTNHGHTHQPLENSKGGVFTIWICCRNVDTSPLLFAPPYVRVRKGGGPGFYILRGFLGKYS